MVKGSFKLIKKNLNKDNTSSMPQYQFCCNYIQVPIISNYSFFSSNNSPTLSAFTLSFVYYNVSDWQIRINLMQQWRSIASRHSKNLNLSVWVWEENSLFVDQMLSLGSTTFQSFVVNFLI